MKRNGLYRLNTADIVIAAIVITVSITPLLYSFNRQKSAAANIANIYQDNKLVKQVAMGKDSVYKFKNMEIEVNRRRVRIAKSDCARQVCVHTGWISSPAQTIVCVPNKVLVEIPGGGAGQYDAVSY